LAAIDWKADRRQGEEAAHRIAGPQAQYQLTGIGRQLGQKQTPLGPLTGSTTSGIAGAHRHLGVIETRQQVRDLGDVVLEIRVGDQEPLAYGHAQAIDDG
jgi:hypothetical protein